MFRKLPIRDTDDEFLFRLYESTRAEELQAWGWDDTTRHQFLQLQWIAQKRAYAAQYPNANHSLICLVERPIGRMLVDHTETCIILIDIALLPEARGKGIGTSLIQELQVNARVLGKSLRLSVLPHNPALALYERLGFQQVGCSGLHVQMEWHSAQNHADVFKHNSLQEVITNE